MYAGSGVAIWWWQGRDCPPMISHDPRLHFQRFGCMTHAPATIAPQLISYTTRIPNFFTPGPNPIPYPNPTPFKWSIVTLTVIIFDEIRPEALVSGVVRRTIRPNKEFKLQILSLLFHLCSCLRLCTVTSFSNFLWSFSYIHSTSNLHRRAAPV